MSITRSSIVVTLAAVASWANAQAPEQHPPAHASASHGAEIAQHWCSSCHLVSSTARAGSDVAPSFRSIAADPSKTPDHLRGFLSRPHWPMPPLQLSGNEIEDIVAYLGTLHRPPQQ
ncbi:MAG: cytochrome c [Acetobacteraceae bacterium]|nr:cytochrome c [Acetobacteraceae bacterium]